MRKFLIITAGASSLVLVLGMGVWTGVEYHDRLAGIMSSPDHRDSRGALATAGTVPHMQAGKDEPKPVGKTLYHCGMHPWIVQDHPGNCPICRMELTPIHGASTQTAQANQASGQPAITVDPAVVQNMGVQTAQVKLGTLSKSLRTVGYLDVPETGLCDITLKFNGYIEKLYTDRSGMEIHKGDPLFDLYSPDLVVAEEELIAARKSVEALSPASEQVRKQAQRLVEGARRKLQLLDIPDSEIDEIAKLDQAKRVITFRSPVEGHLEDKMIVQGSAVQAGMKLMRIEDHSTLWLEAQVYEEQLPLVKLGETLDAMLDAFPGKTFSGKIIFINPHLDHMNRTVAVRAVLDNPNHALRPGMYATVQIHASPIDDAVIVPREAVIDTGTRKIAFVQEAAGHFAPRLVKTGLSGDDDQLQILSGLAPGEMVVTSGQFLMDVESRTQEALQKLQATEHAVSTGVKDATATEPQTRAAPVTTAALPMGGSKRTDEVVKAYLSVAASLQNEPASAVDVTGLLAASRKLADAAPADEKTLAANVSDAVGDMNGQPLDKQRKRFEAVGAAVLLLVEKDPPSTAVAGKLFVANCPMENADWLQTDEVIRNPFVPTMPTCGSITRTIPLTPAK